jgi:hypothetical protein
MVCVPGLLPLKAASIFVPCPFNFSMPSFLLHVSSHPRPRSSHLLVKIVIQVKRELDGLERRGKMFLLDLASPERSISSAMKPLDVEDARDVAVSLLRMGVVHCGC